MIIFDTINILLLIIVVSILFLGFIIFFYSKKRHLSIVYSLNIITIISWIIAMIFFRSSPQEWAKIWCTLLYVFPTFIASSFLYFSYIFPSRKDNNIPIKSTLIFLTNLVMIFMVIWPDFIIKEVNLRQGLEKEIIFTKYYWFYFFYIAGFFTYAFWRLYKKLAKSTGLERLQIIYLLSGYALSANFAFVTNLVLPWLGFFSLNWLGQLFTVFIVAFTAYAILKYRLMDIRIIIKRAFVYFGIGVFVYSTLYAFDWYSSYNFGTAFSLPGYIAGVAFTIVFIFLFHVIDKTLKDISNKYFFASLYTYQETIQTLAEKLTNYIDLKKIIDLIVDTIQKTMQIQRTGVLLIDTHEKHIRYKVEKIIGFERTNGISLIQDNFLTDYITKTRKPLVREELSLLSHISKTLEDRQNFDRLNNLMKRIETSLCIPLLSGKKLIGMIVMGYKISGDAYTKEDLELLSTLSKQASIAIENARLYKTVQDLNKTLSQKVCVQKNIPQEKKLLKKSAKPLKPKSKIKPIKEKKLPISVNGKIEIYNP